MAPLLLSWGGVRKTARPSWISSALSLDACDVGERSSSYVDALDIWRSRLESTVSELSVGAGLGFKRGLCGSAVSRSSVVPPISKRHTAKLVYHGGYERVASSCLRSLWLRMHATSHCPPTPSTTKHYHKYHCELSLTFKALTL